VALSLLDFTSSAKYSSPTPLSNRLSISELNLSRC